MLFLKNIVKITLQFIFVIILIFFSTLEARNLDKYEKANYISDYFSGVLLLNQSKYEESHEYLKKLNGLENSHSAYSTKFLYSLVNSGNLYQAFNYSKKLEKNEQNSFESDLIIGVYYLKNLQLKLSKEYFLKAQKTPSNSILNNYISNSLSIWSSLYNNNLVNSSLELEQLDDRFKSLKEIQNVFLNCYFDNDKTEFLFEKLLTDQKTDFSRYNYFYANYLNDKGKSLKAKKVIEDSLKKYPRNLLLNQYKEDLKESKKNFNFDCKKENHVISELLYLAANALSSQSIISLSNFYLNLAQYLNEDFYGFDTLMAENFYKINDFNTSKKIYEKLKNKGSALKWHSHKQISRILIQQEMKDKSIILLQKAYDQLKYKGVYETFDYAEFLKNNEKFENAINYYSELLNLIDVNHPLYAEATDGRGVAYERLGEWKKAEKDLLNSLKAKPDQAYVMNYLAYSWVEKGIKIEKSLKMLEKANKIKSNDPYIIDSLGWALFKLKRYDESQKYLQTALKLMPADPIVNDHYGDVLWKNGKEIQARYYWNYVLNLEKAEKDLKEKIEKKIIKGL